MRTVAVARLILGAGVNIQVPPNLALNDYGSYLQAGINDWGGISPITLDFINPERAWPNIAELRRVTNDAGYEMRERLAAYPEYMIRPGWMPEKLRQRGLEWTDECGLVRREQQAA
jgi:FO synthase